MHLVYFKNISYHLLPVGKFVGKFVYFLPFWKVLPNKSGNPVKIYFRNIAMAAFLPQEKKILVSIIDSYAQM
jgi:hypothetical protein